jgi:hypothetical protein
MGKLKGDCTEKKNDTGKELKNEKKMTEYIISLNHESSG